MLDRSVANTARGDSMPSFARRPLAVIAALAMSTTLATLAASAVTLTLASPAAAASHSIQITDSAFGTTVLTVQVGDTVTWTNADDRPHTVTSQNGAFDSGNVDEGASFSFTFTEPGTYAYLCEYHPDMTATIVVQAAAAPANPQPASTPAPAGGTNAGAAPHATHEPGSQPDTAVAPPARSIPAASFLLWGAAFLLLAVAFLPRWTRVVATAARPTGGWRR